MKKLFLLLPLLLLLSCAPVLERGDWEEEPYQALCSLLQDQSLRGGYAVFDCDNTTILHDVTHTLMLYLIENLAFADAADAHFLYGLPQTDFPLDGLGLTADEMGDYLSDTFVRLKALKDSGVPLEEIHQTEDYLSFRAAFLAFYKAIGHHYTYGELCLWEPMLSKGLPEEVGEASLKNWLSQGRAWNETWTSPDGRFTGVAEKGLVIPQDMKNLMKALRYSGITPYICSASMEWLVEALACNPENGLGFRPDEVFGVRFLDGDYDPAYIQPFKEGKVTCIESFIAPLYAGAQPALIAGDSSGDVAMLTAFPEMRLGLIMNQHRGDEIEELANRQDGKYYSQEVTIENE